MTTYNWRSLRTRLSQTFKGGPTASQEQRIIEVFQHSPAAVDQLATEVEAAYKRGTSHSPWGLLAKKAEALEAGRDVTVEDTSEREAAIRNAERWVRTTGCQFDRESEVTDELFGHHGKLRHWAKDTELRTRLIQLWQAERPRGQQTEHEHEQYMAKIKAQRHLLTPPKPENP